jgi:hypothetical protein
MHNSILPSHLKKAMSTPTTIQMLVAYLNDGEGRIKLNEGLIKLLDRYDYCDNNIRKYRRKNLVVERQIKKYKISRSLAENDYYNTMSVFNSVPRCTKNYDQEFLIDMGFQLYEKALESGDYRSAASVLKTLNETFKEKWATNEVPQETEPPTILIVSADPNLLGEKPIQEEELLRKFKKWQQTKYNRKASFDEDAQIIEDGKN